MSFRYLRPRPLRTRQEPKEEEAVRTQRRHLVIDQGTLTDEVFLKSDGHSFQPQTLRQLAALRKVLPLLKAAFPIVRRKAPRTR